MHSYCDSLELHSCDLGCDSSKDSPRALNLVKSDLYRAIVIEGFIAVLGSPGRDCSGLEDSR